MSTLRVDRIEPYLSSSVSIEGAIQANAATTGSNTFVGDQNILGTITASIAEGFALVGGVGNISTLVATSSFGGGGAGFPFTGDAVITGSLLISGSAGNDLVVEGRQIISGPTTGQTPQLQISGSDATNTIGRGTIAISAATALGFVPSFAVTSGSSTTTVSPVNIVNSDTLGGAGNTKTISLQANPSKTGVASLAGITQPSLLTFGTGSAYQVFELQSQNNYTNGTISFKVPVAVTGSLSVSSVLQLASLDPLPAGVEGHMANSGSNLYFFSGSAWNRIAFA